MAEAPIAGFGLTDARDRYRLYQAILEISEIITNAISIDRVYHTFARELQRLVALDRAYITTVDQGSNNYVIRYAFGQHISGRSVGDTGPLEGSLTQLAMKTGQTLNRGNVDEDVRIPADLVLLEQGLRSSITVPLTCQGDTFGILGIRSRQTNAFGQREQAILECLTGHVALALKNACLSEQILSTTQEICLVERVARLITSSTDIEEVYEKFALEMKRLVDFDRMNINLIDLDRDVFIFKYVSGVVQPGRRAGDVLPLENSQTQHVMATGRTLIRSDVAADPRFCGDETILKMGMRSTILSPLFAKGRVIGNLSLRSRQVGAYGSREQAILERLARLISPAIEMQRACLPGQHQHPDDGEISGERTAADDTGSGAKEPNLERIAARVGLLSSRQQEVLRALAERNGGNYADIASALYLSRSTVKFHMGAILRKLGVQNRVQAILAWKAWSGDVAR